MFKMLEGLLLCFTFSNSAFFLIAHYQVGQPWIFLILLLVFLVPIALRSNKKIKISGILSALFICSLMYLIGFTREPFNVDGFQLTSCR